MTFKITLTPSGHSFEVKEDEPILQAGIAAGYAIPFSCKQGVCRTCRAKLISGDVRWGDVHPAYLSDEERAQGLIHLCQATALSDATFEIREIEGLAGVTVRKVPCRIAKIERAAPDVTILHLRLPLNENMMFVAGQHIEFLLPGEIRRTYSIATKPNVEGVSAIEVHVRHVPGGFFSEKVLSTLKERDLMKFEGPFGTFHLRTDTSKPIIMLAGGTGFAPVKSMIEYAFAHKIHEKRPIAFYWGARTRSDLYLPDLPHAWAAAHPNFRYVPVLSAATPACEWSGRDGLVHTAVLADLPDMSGYEVYACGSPLMIEAARTDFITKAGLPEDAFFADVFLTSAQTKSA